MNGWRVLPLPHSWWVLLVRIGTTSESRVRLDFGPIADARAGPCAPRLMAAASAPPVSCLRASSRTLFSSIPDICSSDSLASSDVTSFFSFTTCKGNTHTRGCQHESCDCCRQHVAWRDFLSKTQIRQNAIFIRNT